jgi:hypothetical protein
LQFLVREAVPRTAASGHAGLSSVPPTHGLGARVQVRPSGWNVVVSLDGLPPMPLPQGSVLDVRVEPEKGQWLRTLRTMEPEPA